MPPFFFLLQKINALTDRSASSTSHFSLAQVASFDFLLRSKTRKRLLAKERKASLKRKIKVR
jgi:hypothetical protein